MADKQSTIDSCMETVTNVGIGFFISWAVLDWIVSPIYGFQTSASSAFGITMIFTVTSILRQFALRRIFNGRSVWVAIKDALGLQPRKRVRISQGYWTYGRRK